MNYWVTVSAAVNHRAKILASTLVAYAVMMGSVYAKSSDEVDKLINAFEQICVANLPGFETVEKQAKAENWTQLKPGREGTAVRNIWATKHQEMPVIVTLISKQVDEALLKVNCVLSSAKPVNADFSVPKIIENQVISALGPLVEVGRQNGLVAWTREPLSEANQTTPIAMWVQPQQRRIVFDQTGFASAAK